MNDRGKELVSRFVFATLEDNPSLDREEYIDSLWWLPPHERRMLLDGDWRSGLAGEFFKRQWFRMLDVAPRFKRKVRYWDLAASDAKTAAFTAGTREGIMLSDDLCIDHVVRGQWTPGTRDDVIVTTAKMDGVEVPQYFEQEPGSGGKAQIETLRMRLRGFAVRAVPKRTKKEVEWGPLSSWAESRGIYLLRAPWNRAFVDELCGLPKGRKDQADAAAGAFQKLGFARPRIRIRRLR